MAVENEVIDGEAVEVEDDSIRGALEAAVSEAETAEETPPKETPPAEETPAPVEKDPPTKGADGKFKAKEVPVEEPDPNAIRTPKSRAPGSWTPLAREKWAGLPPEIQREVLKRERDIATGFNDIKDVKTFRENYGNLISRHQNIINAEGGDAMKMTSDLFQTAATLYNGSSDQKVRTVAAMIKNFNVDIGMLDQVLAGQVPAQGQQGQQMDIAALIRQQVQEAVAPFARGGEERVTREADNDVMAFADDPANEFFDDVKDTMADLLEVSAKQGKQMDLPTAYKRATMMHSEIADVLSDRQLREKAAVKSAAAVKAKRRAVSITGAPARELATGGRPVGNDLRADLEAAIEANAE